MTDDITNDLNTARQLYMNKDYEDSLSLYEKSFSRSPDEFTKTHRTFYAWAIYQCRIKRFKSDDEFYSSALLITELVDQQDLSKAKACPYTFAVFRVFDRLAAENDYYTLTCWLDRIDPELLDETRVSYDNVTYRSRREKFYDISSKTYLRCMDYEKCIEISSEALETLTEFTNYSDTWHRWRIAKSLRQIGRPDEALGYLKEVIGVKRNWFIHREIAENLIMLQRRDEAIDNLCEAVLTDEPAKLKANLYKLIYDVLKNTDPETAEKHLRLHRLLRDGESDDGLLGEIEAYWRDFKFRDMELHHGTITRYFDDKNYGFITTPDNRSVFFHRDDFNGEDINTGKYVSYYLEDTFNRSKGEKSIKAVCINEVI